MDVVIAVHAAAAVLLLVAGAAKLARPRPAAQLISTLGLPSSPAVVRAIGAVEIAAGVAALAVGGAVPAGVVGGLYIVFALVVARALVVGAESCGCFGRVDTPPSIIHIVGNAGLAAASVLAATADRTPVDAMGDQPGGGAPFVVLVGVLAGLAVVAFTTLPEALAARRGGGPTPPSIRVAPPDHEVRGPAS